MKRIQLWANLLKHLSGLVNDGVLSEATYYQYCSKFINEIEP